jgi:hypothetical protein
MHHPGHPLDPPLLLSCDSKHLASGNNIRLLVLAFRRLNLLQRIHLSRDDSGNAVSNGNHHGLLALERRSSKIKHLKILYDE